MNEAESIRKDSVQDERGEKAELTPVQNHDNAAGELTSIEYEGKGK